MAICICTPTTPEKIDYIFIKEKNILYVDFTCFIYPLLGKETTYSCTESLVCL